jgi:hypothetical protein
MIVPQSQQGVQWVVEEAFQLRPQQLRYQDVSTTVSFETAGLTLFGSESINEQILE